MRTAAGDESARLESFGFATLESCIDVRTVDETRKEILAEYESARPMPFRGGGQWVGHLNYVPSPLHPVIREVVSNPTIKALLDDALGSGYKILGVGGNANLPKSRYQPAHVDEYRGLEFLVINIPLEKTTEDNGSTEVWPGTHRETLTVAQFNAVPRPSVRLNAMPGDVIVRNPRLWHRGTPNNSKDVRVMLAILVARSDQTLPAFTVSEDEYTKLQASGIPLNLKIESKLDRGFMPNYFSTNLKGNVLELTWKYAPQIFTEIRRFKKASI